MNRNHKEFTALFLVAFGFVISRVLYNRAGLVFQGDTYLGYWQFIDPQLLQTDLLRSVFFLHSQPPLMNLFTGMILQAFPEKHAEVFQGFYLISGLILSLSIYGLGRATGLNAWLATGIAIWFTVNPATALYESWLTYSHPLAAMIALAGILLFQYAKTGKTKWGFAGFLTLSLMALTWSLYHLVWLFAIAGFFYYIYPSYKKTLPFVYFPIVLVFFWFAKNYVQVGEFTGSSWMGMNLSRISTSRLGEGELRRLVKENKLSQFALYPPFRNPNLYLELLPDTPKTGIPVLDEPETSMGKRNHHHLVYVEASRYYLKDALYVIRTRPDVYARSVLQSFYIFFHSASDFDLTGGNRKEIEAFDILWNRLFYWQWLNDEDVDRVNNLRAQNVGWGIALAFIVSLFGSALHLWKNRNNLADPVNFLILFMAFNIAYLTLVGNFLELGENNRFRFVIDPFILILFIFVMRNSLNQSQNKE